MTLPARLIAHAECHESQPELMSDPEQRQWAADLREAAGLLSAVRTDAADYGNALNEAGWEFVDSYRRHMGEAESGRLFNACKSILRDCILAYVDAILPTAPKEPRQ